DGMVRPSAIACEPCGCARSRPVGLAAGVGRSVLSVPRNRTLPLAGQTPDEIPLAKLTAGGDHFPVDAVLEDHAVVVNREVGRKAAGAVTITSVGEPLIRLLEALNVERGTAHPGGGDQFRLARRGPQAADGERIRRGRPLEVDIDAAGNLLEPLAVTRPVPLTIRRQAQTALTPSSSSTSRLRVRHPASTSIR